MAAADDAWSGWGGNHANTRHNNAPDNPVDNTSVARLQLKWAYAFDNVRSVVGNPTLSGNRIFIGDENGRVYALDRDSGCEDWVFQAENGVRTTPIVERVNGRWTVFFGDRGANVHAVDAISGARLWTRKVDDHRAAILTGAPQFVRLEDVEPAARLIVPVSSSEEGLGAVPTYPCCSFRGSVVSLDAATGDLLWQTHTIQQPVEETAPGKFGPSGAAVWSAPTLDTDSKTLFVTTGDAYSAPADVATDALVAMELTTGEIRWIRQGTAGDIWTVACMTPNASPDCGPDHDFGSPAMRVTSGDEEILVAGQKSGIIRAYDKTSGEVLWRTALVANTTEFGGKIVWGGAADGEYSYWGMGNNEIAAIRHTDGNIRWQHTLGPAGDMQAHPGLEGPLALSHNVLFSGGWDGVLRALAVDSGEILWSFDTVREYATVNGVSGKGGSMGAVGPIVEDGLILVTSGYVGVKNGATGNVLLVIGID